MRMPCQLATHFGYLYIDIIDVCEDARRPFLLQSGRGPQHRYDFIHIPTSYIRTSLIRRFSTTGERPKKNEGPCHGESIRKSSRSRNRTDGTLPLSWLARPQESRQRKYRRHVNRVHSASPICPGSGRVKT